MVRRTRSDPVLTRKAILSPEVAPTLNIASLPQAQREQGRRHRDGAFQLQPSRQINIALDAIIDILLLLNTI